MLASILGATSVDAAPPGTMEHQTQITPLAVEQTRLAHDDAQRAAQWALSTDEWQRYSQLMTGIRGSLSPATLSPIEVLGIHARSDDERRRYAERWVQLLHNDAQRVLAFQRAYDAAWQRRYPDLSLIDTALIPKADPDEPVLQTDDRLVLFVGADCTACDLALSRVLARRTAVAGIDLYLVGFEVQGSEAVRRWARQQAIDPAWVHERQVTLNIDRGTLARVSDGQGSVPYLLRRRGESLQEIPVSSL
ncbi:MAG: TIGR03759 family integrating conjugative element protein [Gammaproteobacteria bacterium]|nr:TIGR03759 family integrating conjugative element protein [Gammaproteobacteria bacterium]